MSPRDPASGLPDDVQTFLEEQVKSLNELYVLLLLERNGRAWRTAAEASTELYIPEDWVAEQLTTFTRTGLVERRDGDPAAFRLDGEHTRLLGAVGDALRLRRHRVVDAVHGRPRSSA